MQLLTDRDILLVTDGDRPVCPHCGRRTAVRLLPTTQLIDYPLFCKHCKTTVIVHTAPAPLGQSR